MLRDRVPAGETVVVQTANEAAYTDSQREARKGEAPPPPSLHEAGCRTLCLISFGRTGNGWLDATIATTEDDPESVETLSRTLLNDAERLLLDRD